MSDPAEKPLGEVARLEEIVDREALRDVCRSFFDLFGISIRIFSKDGTFLADAHEQREICQYLNTLSGGRIACGATVAGVKTADPQGDETIHPCFTGAVYRIVPIEYQGRRLGRFVIGPYLPSEVQEVPPSLLAIDPQIDAEKARETLALMPRVREETTQKIVQHLRGVLDLIVFASHQAHLTSEMHIASVRESYRELAEKTAKLQQAYDRLKELDRLKSNFLATISHELRTPLTSIIGYSEMLASDVAGELNPEQREFVETVRSKGDQLLGLISSLLDLSKMEQGSVALDRQPVDVPALVTDLLTTVRPQAERKQIALVAEVDKSVSELLCDGVRMRQVLLNLIDNALKFTTNGGKVLVGARPSTMGVNGATDLGAVLMAEPKQAMEFYVRDSGIGIPRDEHSRIFDAFYQVDGSSTREHGGAGLGLSIVKRLVDAHQGEIRIESEMGKGTTFYVTVPEPDEANA